MDLAGALAYLDGHINLERDTSRQAAARRLDGIDGGRLFVSLIKVVTASLIMTAAVVAIDHGAAVVIAGIAMMPSMIRIMIVSSRR